ncbi:hypothetical protein EVAR_78580_1 [Eumeta japonica]|uniref:Uncharacterized protein n=1 Tax=Eumeta variegata TaxID=151549 RepID=A0A4C1W9Q2_EUMVA|nr:hypothetical protein EVAR_78580_1 [Eumeta japonica]
MSSRQSQMMSSHRRQQSTVTFIRTGEEDEWKYPSSFWMESSGEARVGRCGVYIYLDYGDAYMADTKKKKVTGVCELETFTLLRAFTIRYAVIRVPLGRGALHCAGRGRAGAAHTRAFVEDAKVPDNV